MPVIGCRADLHYFDPEGGGTRRSLYETELGLPTIYKRITHDFFRDAKVEGKSSEIRYPLQKHRAGLYSIAPRIPPGQAHLCNGKNGKQGKNN